MKKIKIRDALGGHVHVSKGKGKYFRTSDSTSPSGHSLVAQIDMTHSGIVTRNYGFYLPARMKAGAYSFTKDYKKPVLIGHDEITDTKPVGRVINAEYIDTSERYVAQDSYLKSLIQFNDEAGDKSGMLDFVQHVIKNYDTKDTYKGMGHLRGTVKITDEETIAGILDETFLTVSTSMVSDSASCSVCGTDWVKDGLCDHSRGQVYDDDVCVVIPGSMEYDHLGIVNTPADPHAHDFRIVGDDPTQTVTLNLDNTNKDLYQLHDHYDLAAELFACNDSAIIPLGSKTDVNLIEIKDNIQKMENAMKTIEERIKDALDVKVEVYRFGSEESGSKEVTVREYMEEMDTEGIQSMVAQIAQMLASEDSAKVSDEDLTKVVDKYFVDNYELAKASTEPDADPATTDDKVEGFFGEVIYDDQVVYKGGGDAAHGSMGKKKRKKKKSKKMSDAFKLEDGEEITHEMVAAEVNEINAVEGHELDNLAVVELAELVALHKNEDAIVRSTFNWSDDRTYESIVNDFKEWNEGAIILDSVSGEEIYEEMKQFLDEATVLEEEAYGSLKASDYCGMRGYFPVTDEAHAKAALAVLAKCKVADSVKGRILCAVHRKAKRLGLDLTDNFDSISEPCNNNDSISVEEAVKAYEDAKAKLVEMGVEIPETVQDNTEQETEIQILESQLEAANEELDSLSEENNLLKTQLLEELATRTVDMKMLSGNYEITDRVEEITSHKERTVDSLKDGLKDLETQFKIQDFVENNGIAQAPQGTVEDPTLSQNDSKAGKPVEEEKTDSKFKLYDEYNNRVATYGKQMADRWLARVQKKNGSIPTID